MYFFGRRRVSGEFATVCRCICIFFSLSTVNLDHESNVPFHGRNQDKCSISSVMRQLNKQS